jgi:MoaA/NifB/PqqE/SkfB family radical SAM enzyme
VLSKYNAGSFLELLEYIKELQPDSYIVEYAQRRRELHNTQKDFIAAEDEYARCIDMLQGCRGGTDKKGAQRYIAILRKHYYSLSKEILRYKRQVIPCFAGFASAHIAADGEVWACGVAAHSMGALRHAGYRFQALWLDKKAQEARNSIKQQRCYCLNANSAYQNMLFNGRYLWKIGLDFFRA